MSSGCREVAVGQDKVHVESAAEQRLCHLKVGGSSNTYKRATALLCDKMVIFRKKWPKMKDALACQELNGATG